MSLVWLRCITLQRVLAAVVVEMSVAHMLQQYLSFVKVSVTVAAGADNCVLLPCFEFCCRTLQPRFYMSESLLLLPKE